MSWLHGDARGRRAVDALRYTRCLHQAAHSVVARDLGWFTAQGTGDDMWCGTSRSAYLYPPRGSAADLAGRRAVWLLAGPTALRRGRRGLTRDVRAEITWDQDAARAALTRAAISPERATATAAALVRTHWTAIEAKAEAMVAAGGVWP